MGLRRVIFRSFPANPLPPPDRDATRMTEKTKLLFLAADPYLEGPSLQLDEEARAVTNAIPASCGLEVVSAWAVRVNDIQRAVLHHRPGIVHFAGHAGAGRGIILGDEFGFPSAVGFAAVAGLLGIVPPRPRLAVLNACDTASALDAFGEVVDYTVAMNAPVEDRSSILFAGAFYAALAVGETVRHAFELGVNRLHLEASPDAAVPCIRVRDGVDESLPLAPVPAQRMAPLGPLARGTSLVEQDEMHLQGTFGVRHHAGDGISIIRSGVVTAHDALFESNPPPRN
jgi:hypothetical protein